MVSVFLFSKEVSAATVITINYTGSNPVEHFWWRELTQKRNDVPDKLDAWLLHA